MKFVLWHHSSTCTRRAFLKTRKAFGRPYYYFPQYRLIQRWSRELNMTEDEVIEQFYKERRFLVKYFKGEDIIY